MGSFTVGPFAFSVNLGLIFAAVLISFAVSKLIGRKRGIDVESALWKILIVGVAAARLAFVLRYLDIYRQAPLSIIDIRDGGFVPAVGILAALAAAAWFSWREQSWRKPLLLSLLAGAFAWSGASAIVVLNSKPGSAPQAVLTTLDGRAVQLDSLAGKPMVVNLWATWCPPCRREMPALRDAQLRDKDVVFVFANQGESAETIRKYLDSERLTLDNVLLDPSGELGRKTGLGGMPTTLFFDSKGQLVNTRIGELSAATLAQRIHALRAAK